MVELARDEGLRRRLADRALDRASRLVWERSEAELLEAYEELAS